MTDLLIDMPSGIAGDMLLAALLGCGGDQERLIADLGGLGVGALSLASEAVSVGGLAALRVCVSAPQEAGWEPTLRLGPGATVSAGHGHRPYPVVRGLIERATLAPRVRERALAVFRVLAEAEAAVHGTTVESVHFHEVGSLDAIADVVGCCLLLEQLEVERIVAGPLRPGHGTVGCAHGRMPVPVPAVARMLATPTPRTGTRPPWLALGWETGELTTPTGAALVCALADGFIGTTPGTPGPILGPVLAVGYGAGSTVIPGLVNVVRCTLCAATAAPASGDQVSELTCHLDDITGEELAWLLADLLAAGALDAVAAPLVMKKGRAGHALTVITRLADGERLATRLLLLSPSLGVRRRVVERMVLPRSAVSVRVAGQVIALKIAHLPDGTCRAKPEADDVAAAAAVLGIGFAEVSRRALAAWTAG